MKWMLRQRVEGGIGERVTRRRLLAVCAYIGEGAMDKIHSTGEGWRVGERAMGRTGRAGAVSAAEGARGTGGSAGEDGAEVVGGRGPWARG